MEDVGKLLRIVTKVQKQIRESIPLEIEEKLNKKKNKNELSQQDDFYR